MIELSKEIKIVVEGKVKHPAFSAREDIKANLQVDLILLLEKNDYPSVTIDGVYKEILEQAENFKKYQGLPERDREAAGCNCNKILFYYESYS